MPSEMPGVKRQILCDPFIWGILRVVKVIKTGIVIVVAWGLRGGENGGLFNRYRVSVSLDEELWV